VARPIVVDYAKVEAAFADKVPGLKFIVRRARGGFDRLTSNKTSLLNAIAGVNVANDPQLRERLQILKGDLDGLLEPNTILLFARQASELEVEIGDNVTLTGLTARGVRNRADLRVAAIAKDMGGLSQILTFIPEGTLNEFYQLRADNTGVLMLFLEEREQSTNVAGDLRQLLRDKGWDVLDADANPYWQKQQNAEREDWVGQRLDVSTWRDEMGQLADIVDALDAFAVVFVFVLMGVIAIGIWNTLFMAVRERTPEIGALRAIGMSRGRVRFMFIAEAFMLALGASLFGGLLLAVTTVVLVNAAEIEVASPQLQFVLMSDTFTLSLDFARIAGAIAFISVLTALAAWWPASRAAGVQPGVAMGGGQ